MGKENNFFFLNISEMAGTEWVTRPELEKILNCKIDDFKVRCFSLIKNFNYMLIKFI
jgi:hypothetical protein